MMLPILFDTNVYQSGMAVAMLSTPPGKDTTIILERFGDNLLTRTGDGYYAVFDSLGLVQVTASKSVALVEFWRVCGFD